MAGLETLRIMFFLILANVLPLTLQYYQDAPKMSNSFGFDSQSIVDEPIPTGHINSMWSDMDDAFRFLASQRRIQKQRKIKRLPESIFVRIGKRAQGEHSFVRIGRLESPNALNWVDSAKSSPDKRFYRRHSFVRFGRSPDSSYNLIPSDSSYKAIPLEEPNTNWLDSFDNLMQGDLTRSHLSVDDTSSNIAEALTASLSKTSDKQADDVPMQGDPLDDIAVQQSDPASKSGKRHYSSARIGRIPANLFFRQRALVPRRSSGDSSSSGVQSVASRPNYYHRYGRK